jgi:hypothetical protein
MQRHGNPVWRDVDALDQEPKDARLAKSVSERDSRSML